MPRFKELNGWSKVTLLLALNLLLSLTISETSQAQPKPKAPTVQHPKAPTPQTSTPPPLQSSDDDEEPKTPKEVKDIDGNLNPLNPAGDSIEKLITLQMSDDLWKAMIGKLPCLEANDECLNQLQTKAIENSKTLKAIDERVEAIQAKIDEATKNNKKSVALGVFEPLVRSYLTLESVPVQQGQTGQKIGFIDKVLSVFIKPISGVNEILSLIGLPLFQNATGTNNEAQQRSIAIGDLQAKVAEIQNKRGELADKIREQVIISVLDFDTVRRDFQITQEIVRRESSRMKLLEVAYRYGQGDTDSFMARQTSFDGRKAETYRQWARMRSQLAKIKLLVLGAKSEE